jgi:hypothetical protein
MGYFRVLSGVKPPAFSLADTQAAACAVSAFVKSTHIANRALSMEFTLCPAI